MKKFSILLLALLIICFTSNGLAQQTGSLKGTITDDEGNPLPGVTVSITSPNMQGSQSYVSTADGDFRFPTLPPGIYAAKTELSGFQTTERPEIRVRVGSTTTINVEMVPSTLDEEITVTAPSPIIDIEATDISVTMDSETITNLPIQRDILDIYQTIPSGVPRAEDNDYQKSVVVAGGAFHESKIAIDGVDLVDPSRGYVNAEVSFDAIDEVELVVGGHKAETGQVSAGFVNVVTKSGGNTFSGTITSGGTTDSLTQIIVPQEEIEAFGLLRPQLKEYKYDIGISLGGPIIKDKVWFFVAPRYATYKQSTFFIPFTDPDGIYHPAFDNTRDDYIGLGKITVQLASNLKWFGMYQYNRGYEVPEMWSVTRTNRPLESTSDYDDHAHTISSVLTFVMNQNSFLEARFGMVRRLMSMGATGKWEGPEYRPSHSDRATGYQWGRSGSGSDYHRNNMNLGLIFTRFQDDLLGADHEIKVGLEYGRADRAQKNPRFNPYTYYWNRGEPWYYSDTAPFQGRISIYSGPTGDQDRGFEAGFYRWGGFLQDTFTIGERLTVNLGLRYDESHAFVPASHYEGYDDVWENGLANVLLPSIFQPAGSTLDAPALDDLMVYKFLSPRIGLSYDLFGDGKTILKGSFARYGEAMFTSTVEYMIPLKDRSVTFTWWDENMNGELDLPPIDRYQPGGYAEYDTDVQPLRDQLASEIDVPYMDELTLGVTQQITSDFSISLNYMYKRGDQMLATNNLSFSKDSEWWIPYTVTDPGWDMKLGTGDEKDLTVFMLRSDAPPNFFQTGTIDDGWRKYHGVNLIFNKRMSHGWMVSGSIALSESTSNVRWGYLTYAGWENYWDPNVDIYREGKSENDRPIIIKLMSTIELPLGFNLSTNFRHISGEHFERHVTVFFPSTLNGYKPKSASVGVNAEPEGSRHFGPETVTDIRLEKSFSYKGIQFGVWADVFNLFGQWSFYWYQYRGSNAYSSMATRIQGGYIYNDGSVARYANYGVPDAVYGTRYLVFGARVRF